MNNCIAFQMYTLPRFWGGWRRKETLLKQFSQSLNKEANNNNKSRRRWQYPELIHYIF